jgi:hypothetical protein
MPDFPLEVLNIDFGYVHTIAVWPRAWRISSIVVSGSDRLYPSLAGAVRLAMSFKRSLIRARWSVTSTGPPFGPLIS